MNQFKSLRGDEISDPPIECNIQPPEVYFKSFISPPKTIPVVLAIIWIRNHLSVDNVDVDVYPSEYPFESTSESVPDPDTTLIK